MAGCAASARAWLMTSDSINRACKQFTGSELLLPILRPIFLGTASRRVWPPEPL
jgi:hypothetical protein